MSEEQEPWARQENEPTLWYERFLVYLQMGPARTLLGAVHEVEKAEKSGKKRSSRVPGAWDNAVEEWDWKKRAEAWDDYRRKQVFTTGNAYDVTRVEKLNKYSEALEAELDKVMAALARRKKITKPWFNPFLYEKYLQSLEALAAETGGRIKKSEATLHLPPDLYAGITPEDEGSEP